MLNYFKRIKILRNFCWRHWFCWFNCGRSVWERNVFGKALSSVYTCSWRCQRSVGEREERCTVLGSVYTCSLRSQRSVEEREERCTVVLSVCVVGDVSDQLRREAVCCRPRVRVLVGWCFLKAGGLVAWLPGCRCWCRLYRKRGPRQTTRPTVIWPPFIISG